LNTKGRLTTDEAKKRLPCLSESVRTNLKTGRKKTEHDKLLDRTWVLAFTKPPSGSEKALIAVNTRSDILRDGMVVGLAKRSVLIAKVGTERPIDESAAPMCKGIPVPMCYVRY
jgi:hypothetical protein